MRRAVVLLLACAAIVALIRLIPPQVSATGMQFLVAVDASGKVYLTYGNYSTAETCSAVLNGTPAPGRGLHLECRDLGGRSIPPRGMVVVPYLLAVLIGPSLETLASAVALAAVPLRGPLAGYPIFWRLVQDSTSVLTDGPTGWVTQWVFSRLGYPPMPLVVAVIGAAVIATVWRRLGKALKLPRIRVPLTRRAGNFPSDINYYEVLQVHPAADVAVIKSAYRTIMRELQAHPDLGGDEEQAKVVNEAHRVLTDPDLRAAYDATRRATERAANNFPAGSGVGIGDLSYAAVVGGASQEIIVRSVSWGYAGLPFIYLVANRAWWHLLANAVGAAIPVVNIAVYVWYLFNAKRLVQSTRKYKSFDRYLEVQEGWDRAGKWALAIGLVLVVKILGQW